ncbi:hypothetical protein COH20_005050 [Aspergillus flavus]|nr:hypothetical protein COH20_005050 [Aspergillus flavus]RAQ74638.1 hypothetical protein COH21_010272 [Aspergillus flavus]
MAAPPGSIFLQNLGLFSSLTSIKEHSTEAPVNMLWQNICSTFFPTAAGFKIGSNLPLLQDDTQPDCSVIQIVMLNPDPRDPHSSTGLAEKQILVVECKRPSKDRPTEWNSANDQLEHYCENNVNGSSRIFAVTAIGRKVRFWQYDSPNLTPLRYDVLDLNETEGRAMAEECLNHIRTHGWTWTESGSRLA